LTCVDVDLLDAFPSPSLLASTLRSNSFPEKIVGNGRARFMLPLSGLIAKYLSKPSARSAIRYETRLFEEDFDSYTTFFDKAK
jgi:hypothetical protein